ncbi:MAG: type II secretion system F family protein [Bacillota bacterium]
MPDYKYKAINTAGKTVEGIHTARNREEVITMLRGNKYFPVSVEEHVQSKQINISLFNKVKLKDISIFCRQFHAMLNAGVSIINCLDILRQQIENKRLKTVTGEVYELVQKGLTLSEALRRHMEVFPELLVNMIEAGEASGNLDTIMDRMATHYDKENRISRKVKGAMVYPAFLGSIATLVVTGMLIFIFPTFVSLFEQVGAELPTITRFVQGLSNGLQKYWYIVIAVIILAVYMLKRFSGSEAGRLILDGLKFKIPVMKSTTSKIVTSRFARTLSTLMSSGMPLLHAMELVAKVVGNKVVEKGILNAKEEVRKGVSLAGPIKKIGIFPPMLISMLSIGEESGTLDDVLERTATFYDGEVEAAIDNMTKLLEPIMLLVMAVMIGFIAVAMLLPMFDIMTKIQY